jgi:hypothetical protein
MEILKFDLLDTDKQTKAVNALKYVYFCADRIERMNKKIDDLYNPNASILESPKYQQAIKERSQWVVRKIKAQQEYDKTWGQCFTNFQEQN